MIILIINTENLLHSFWKIFWKDQTWGHYSIIIIGQAIFQPQQDPKQYESTFFFLPFHLSFIIIRYVTKTFCYIMINNWNILYLGIYMSYAWLELSLSNPIFPPVIWIKGFITKFFKTPIIQSMRKGLEKGYKNLLSTQICIALDIHFWRKWHVFWILTGFHLEMNTI